MIQNYGNFAVKYQSDDIEHHGILGQKWGKKNGPPYPLDESDKSSAEKKSETVFISGSSKTQDKNSEFYRKKIA